MSTTADLLLDARGPEIQHRSGLTAPDPFIYLAADGKKPTVYFDAREYDVQKNKLKKLKNGVHIERLEPYVARVKKGTSPALVGALLLILKENKVTTLRVSPQLPYHVAHALHEAGVGLTIYAYEDERARKTKREIEQLTEAQRVNESAFEIVHRILVDSVIRKNRILYEGEVLTSEHLKFVVCTHLLKAGYSCPDGIIVASGPQAARPHDEGEGPLLPHATIIVDIFPRSEKTGFYADMTRTFVKGTPSKKVCDLFFAVESVQREVCEGVEVGDSCAAVHQRTVKAFAKLGHITSPTEGFMHGTGHGLGLQVHEEPRFNALSTAIVEPGMVMTVEPGLYYPKIGGVRIEDVVIFHPRGRKENITHFNLPSFIP